MCISVSQQVRNIGIEVFALHSSIRWHISIAGMSVFAGVSVRWQSSIRRLRRYASLLVIWPGELDGKLHIAAHAHMWYVPYIHDSERTRRIRRLKNEGNSRHGKLALGR